MYVYQVKVELHVGDAPLFPDEAYDMSLQTIVYKCERKARNFVIKTIQSWSTDDRFSVWNPESGKWCVDSKVTNARCTFLISEIKVRT